MSKVNRYGKNEWKRKMLNILFTLFIIVVVGGVAGTGYFLLKPRYEQYQLEKVRKEEEEKKHQEEELAKAKKAEEDARKKVEEEERAKKEAEAKKAEEELKAKKAEEEERAKKEAEAKKAEEELKAKKEAEAKKAAEEEAAKKVQAEIEQKKKEAEKAKQEAEKSAANSSNDYIIPDSNKKYLSSSDIKNLSLREINYAKNEIYARHGRKFKSNELQRYFGSKSWYNGNIDPDNFDIRVFNDYEQKNAEFLSSVEMSMSPNGYQLDK